ncbi:MAG: winged helix-turn-helix domain-containing protein [Mediterraneibacter faecis]
MAGAEKRNITKSKIVNYIINHEATSKVELSKDLNLSMPTVLSNVNELLANGIAVETGEYESTGGRKAKRISINPSVPLCGWDKDHCEACRICTCEFEL